MDMVCQEHQYPIQKICIDDHQCQDRRLCVDCILNRHQQVRKEKMLSIKEFFDLITNKLQDFKQVNYQGFFKTIQTLQWNMNSLFEQLKTQIESVIEKLINGDELILQLKDQLTARTIVEFSRGDYDFMKDILEGQKLHFRLNWREKCKAICQDQLQRLLNTSQQLLSQIQQMTEETICEQLDNNLKLRGQREYGLKHGEFYYVFDYGTTIYAGNYVLGKKQGLWKDYLGYYKAGEKKVFDTVKYHNGINIGKEGWPVGQFDQEFNKTGIWQEVNGKWNQLITKGEYEKGLRTGQWKSYFQDGEGEFNQGQKTGYWKEVAENCEFHCKVTFSGEYGNGVRVGKWSTEYEGEKIGGGTYSEGVKIGQWTDLHENFGQYYQVTFSGEYRNGVRVGNWSTEYKGEMIGGGTYDEKGLKIDQWTDLHENFGYWWQVTFSGEYKNGVRFGNWLTKYKGEKIGGGTYDEKGVKNGQWIDLHENFGQYCQVTFTGEYRNGMRVGFWSIEFQANQIGGGTYDEKGVKSGQWTDLHEYFGYGCQVTFSGQYSNGVRFGQWITMFQANQIGDGTYDEKGMKNGQWTDLHENFGNGCQVTFSGKYSNGVRIEQWMECKGGKSTFYKLY